MTSTTRRRLLTATAASLLLGRGGSGHGAPREVTDMAGRRVAIPARLERIASAGGSPAVNAFLFLFGLGPRIVTGLPAAFQAPAWRLQRYFAPGIASLPAVSGPPPAWTPNVEALLALRPDIAFVVSEPAAAILARAGLPAIVLNWDRPDGVERTIRLLAEIFAAEPRARDYFAWESDLRSRIARRLGQPAWRPRVLYMRYSTLSQPIMLPANQMIERAGGLSVTAGDNPLGLDVYPFSIEQILAWQPEVILLAFAEEAGKLAADPRLATLPAMRSRRIHGVPHGAHIWTHYTPEHPLGVLWLARLLHPEQLADQDLRREADYFYRHFFGRALPEDELARLTG